MPTRSSLSLIIAIPRGCWPLPVSENKTPVFLQSILYAFLFPGHRGGERERKYLTKHLTFLSPLSSLFPLSLGTESLSELLFQPPSLTPHPDYHAFINFDSLCYWYTSHVTSPWKSGNSWPQEACGPQFRSLISSSLEKKKKNFCQPGFILPLVQADDGQTPQPCLLNMNESCNDRIAMPSDKLSIFLRQASGL